MKESWLASPLPVPVHGCMIGRAAYYNPWIFTTADERFYPIKSNNRDESSPISSEKKTRREVIDAYLEYALDMQDNHVFGSRTPNIVKPLNNFFYDCITYNYKSGMCFMIILVML